MKGAFKELLGKTIMAVYCRENEDTPVGQVFLVFDNNTYFEIYSAGDRYCSLKGVQYTRTGGLDSVKSVSYPKGKVIFEAAIEPTVPQRRKISQDGLAILPLVEHVSYVVECLVIGATREAKYEMERIVDLLDEGDYAPIAEQITGNSQRLKEASELFARGEDHRAAGVLSSVLRSLWNVVIPTQQQAAK